MLYAILAQATQQSTRVPLSQQSTEYLVFRAVVFLVMHIGLILTLIAWWKRWPIMRRLRWKIPMWWTDEQVRPVAMIVLLFFVVATLGEVILHIIELVKRW